MSVIPAHFTADHFSRFEKFILHSEHQLLQAAGCTFLTLEDINSLCLTLHERISKSFTPDSIIGISTGGYYAAQRLAALFSTPCHELSLAREKRTCNNLEISDLIGYGKLFPRKHLALQRPFTVRVQGQNLLLVDDDYGTEATFNMAANLLLNRGASKIQKTVLIEPYQAANSRITAALRQTPVNRYIKGRIRFPWNQNSIHYWSYLEWRDRQP